MKIFLSSANKNIETAGQVYEKLKQQGFDIWWYKKSLNVGEKPYLEMKKAIHSCKYFIPLFSNEYNDSEVCKREMMEAENLEFKGDIEKVVPIILGDFQIPDRIKKGFQCIRIEDISSIGDEIEDLFAKKEEPSIDQKTIPTWATEAVEELQAIMVIGREEISRPHAYISREEIAKIIILAADVSKETGDRGYFSDVPSSSEYCEFIETMYNYGWIDRYENNLFYPKGFVTRGEIAKFICKAFEIPLDQSKEVDFADVEKDNFFFPYIKAVYKNGLMLGFGDGTFSPYGIVTVIEVIKIVYEGLLVVTEPQFFEEKSK